MIFIKRNLYATLTGLVVASASQALVVQQEVPQPFMPDFKLLLPGHTPSTSSLQAALAALNAGRLDEARHLAQSELTVAPNTAPAHEILGAIWALDGDLVQARKALEKALSLDSRQWTAQVKLGDLDLAQGNRLAAQKHFEAASKLGGDDPQLQQRLGLMAFYNGHFDAAETHFRKGVVGLAADSVSIRPYLAWIHNQRGHYAQTLALFQEVPLQKMNDAQSYIAVGTALAGLDRMQEAKTLLDDARPRLPAHPGLWLLSGRILRQMGLFTEALPVLTKAVQLSPNNREAGMDLALAEIGAGNLPAGLARAQKLAQSAPANTSLQLGMAQAYAQAQQPDKAIAAYRSLLDAPQARRSAALGLARQLMLAGSYKDAQAVLEKVQTHEPHDTEILRMLGSVQATQGHYATAAQTYRKALQQKPVQPELLQLMSMAQARAGDAAGALQTAQKLVDMEPENPKALLLLAMQQEGAGKLEQAQSSYEAVLARDSQNLVAGNNLALILLERGQTQRAQDLATQLHQRAGNDPQLLDTVGWVYLRSNRIAEGRKILEQVIALPNASPNAWYHYAVLLSEQGEKQKAGEAARKALALSPTFKYARQARALAS